MRLAIVSETWPPEINGVALTVHGLAAGMAARDHDVEVVRPRQALQADAEPGIDDVLVRGAALPRYPGLRFGLPAPGLISRRWRQQRPDAVYIATEGPLGRSALNIARKLGIPTATGFHTRFDHYATHYGLGWLTPMVRGYLRRFHGRSQATLVPTVALAEELRGLGIDNARLLRRAVDTTLFHPQRRDDALRSQWGIDALTPAVLYVGRIAAEKNLDLAVRAFMALATRRPDARFVWVGDGPERAALQAAHPDFVFTGMQRGEALAAHYASADLFLFPSLSETFGNVVLEALASGVPTVAFASGAAREHLHDGANGRLIACGDDEGFVNGCLDLADMDTLRRMRLPCRNSVAELAPASVIDEFEALLSELAASARTPRPRAPVSGARDETLMATLPGGSGGNVETGARG